MAGIVGLKDMSHGQLEYELEHGAKFVVYQYVISILFMSFKRSSAIYYVPADESRVVKGLPYSLVAFLFGWWGFPWGLIWTPGALVRNFGGGEDVTTTVSLQILGRPISTSPKIAQVFS